MSPDYPPLEILEPLENPSEVKFVVYEFIGTEIFKAPEGLSLEQLRDQDLWPSDFSLDVIRDPNGLQVGDFILYPGGHGTLHPVEVRGNAAGLHFQVGDLIGILDFDDKDRSCWIWGGTMNLSGIMKLDLQG